MRKFIIERVGCSDPQPPNLGGKELQSAIQEKIDNLNKPKGSLGRLEELAMQVCLVQQTLEPSLAHPVICCWVATTVLSVRALASHPVR